MAKYQIDINKKYKIPKEVSIIEHNGVFLIISPETAKWMVFTNKAQVEIFESLKDNSIGNILLDTKHQKQDIQHVITQLEARHFCFDKVFSATGNDRGLHLYLTNKCNLYCPHCYMFSGIGDKNELDTAEILNLFKEFRSSGGSRVTLSGGEPTVRSDFDILVKAASDTGLKVRVLSNGSLWDQDRVDRLSPYIDSIQISIDGYSELTNAPIRGKGHFTKALKAVDCFLNNGVNTSIGVTPPFEVLQTNLEDYYEFARNISNQYKGKPILIKFSEGLLLGRDVCPSKQINQEYWELMQKLQNKLHGEDYDVMSFARVFREDVIMDNCMFGVLTISANGDVFFCARISDLKSCANIRTTPFDDIISIAEKAEKSTMINKLEPCGKCNLRYICGGGCRIDEFKELVDRVEFDSIDYSKIKPRTCNEKHKNLFYDLMIRSNKYLYKELM